MSRFMQNFAFRNQLMQSELFLFSHDGWFIKFRATYPVGERSRAEPAIKAFIDELEWP